MPHFLVMLSKAKHLVFRDSSVAFGFLRMTKEMSSPPLLALMQTVLRLQVVIGNQLHRKGEGVAPGFG